MRSGGVEHPAHRVEADGRRVGYAAAENAILSRAADPVRERAAAAGGVAFVELALSTELELEVHRAQRYWPGAALKIGKGHVVARR